MRVLISGASGLIGSALKPGLRKAGHEMTVLVRKKTGSECCDFLWDPYRGEIDDLALEGTDAVIHLSGKNLSERWTAANKQAFRDSRLKSTRFLCEQLVKMAPLPKVFICASAMGFYGDRGDEVLTEDSKVGSGYLSELVYDWEAATKTASDAGIRVVNIRIGLVLSKKGGALAKMLLPFKMGVGGLVGNGKQYWSWITIDDVVGAVQHILENEKVAGPVNLVSPTPATNQEFTKALGKALSRPTILPVPAFGVKMAFGEMGENLLLGSTRVIPQRLKESGYEFKNPELEGALKAVLS